MCLALLGTIILRGKGFARGRRHGRLRNMYKIQSCCGWIGRYRIAARRSGKEVDADNGRAIKESRGDQTERYGSVINDIWLLTIIRRRQGSASNTQNGWGGGRRAGLKHGK